MIEVLKMMKGNCDKVSSSFLKMWSHTAPISGKKNSVQEVLSTKRETRHLGIFLNVTHCEQIEKPAGQSRMCANCQHFKKADTGKARESSTIIERHLSEGSPHINQQISPTKGNLRDPGLENHDK